jgi:hypothetical protein
MSARTQITLDPKVRRRAQAKASELGISFAEYVRRLVASDLGAAKRKKGVPALLDLGASAASTDIARDKDKMVADAVWQDHVSGTRGAPKRSAKRRKA